MTQSFPTCLNSADANALLNHFYKNPIAVSNKYCDCAPGGWSTLLGSETQCPRSRHGNVSTSLHPTLFPRAHSHARSSSLREWDASLYRRYLFCKIYLGFPCPALLTVHLRWKYCQQQGWMSEAGGTGAEVVYLPEQKAFLLQELCMKLDLFLPGWKNKTTLQWSWEPAPTKYRQNMLNLVSSDGLCSGEESERQQQEDAWVQTPASNPFLSVALFPPWHLNSSETLS